MPNIIKIGTEQIKLTDKELMFCEYYLSDAKQNAAQAALLAGYSPRTARKIGSENLAKRHIEKYLDFKKKPLLEKLGVTQEKVIAELAKIGFSDITDFLDENYSMKSMENLDPEKTGAISQIEIKTEQSENGGKDTTIKFKTWDKLKALIPLAEMAGAIQKGDGPIAPVQNNYFGPINNHIKGQ